MLCLTYRNLQHRLYPASQQQDGNHITICNYCKSSATHKIGQYSLLSTQDLGTLALSKLPSLSLLEKTCLQLSRPIIKLVKLTHTTSRSIKASAIKGHTLLFKGSTKFKLNKTVPGLQDIENLVEVAFVGKHAKYQSLFQSRATYVDLAPIRDIFPTTEEILQTAQEAVVWSVGLRKQSISAVSRLWKDNPDSLNELQTLIEEGLHEDIEIALKHPEKKESKKLARLLEKQLSKTSLATSFSRSAKKRAITEMKAMTRYFGQRHSYFIT
ncbi:hypothetical protein HDU76_009384, partial [Blyttiomyces sp. JEL0837]